MYENPNRLCYSFPLYDYGAGSTGVNYIKGPKGKGGYLVDYGVQNIQEDFAGSSSDASVQVGNVGDADAYGKAITFDETIDVADGGATLLSEYALDDRAAFEGASGWSIPADTAVYVTSTSAVGTPTGQACPFVVIDWAW